MRLINATTFKIHEFLSDEDIPTFAILSHTWGKDEVTLQQMDDPNVGMREGYEKIKLCCEQVLADGIQWAWVDTCCIDKTSTAELSEAINSMFRWYRNAKFCYAFLSDVKLISELPQSRWFKRGWTLQELVAPDVVRFYSSDWQYLGTKIELRQQIQQITSIEEEVLTSGNLELVNIARRMSWAASRQTTRIEDLAYCLMGIFNVNMPLLYGEGKKAFTRLQEEIMRVSDDQSLFAWGLPANVRTMQEFLQTCPPPDHSDLYGLFANAPSDFTFSNHIHRLENQPSVFPPIVSNSGVRIELQIKRASNRAIQFAVICCTMTNRYTHYLAFPIFGWGERWVARYRELVTVAVADLVSPKSDKPYGETSVLLVKAPSIQRKDPSPRNIIKYVPVLNDYHRYYTLEEVSCSAHATYSVKDQAITLSQDTNKLHAIFFFVPNQKYYVDLFPPPDHRQIKDRLLENRGTIRTKDSFVYTATNARSSTSYTVVHPPFAIMVGGAWESPWAESVLILSEDHADADFQKLHNASERLIQSCSKKGYLLSLLNNEQDVYPLRGNHYKHHSLQIVHWSYSYRILGGYSAVVRLENMKLETKVKNPTRGPLIRKAEGKRGLLVESNLRLVSSNLVERNLFLFVEVKRLGDEEKATSEKPKWWNLDGQGYAGS